MKIVDFQIYELTQRINALEEKVFKSKRKITTLAQQILLLKHSGLLAIILERDISQKDKSLFLSALLNADPNNIEKDLRNILKDENELSTDGNYEFVLDVFVKSKMTDIEDNVKKIIENLRKKRVTL